jgi:hypothetical protein
MLTDTALKHLKPKEKMYKVTDRDGMYVVVRPSGTLSFQLDYRMNGRRETVIFGKYGPAGLSLARAREMCIDAKRAIKEGRSPAIEKQRDKRRLLEAKSFGELGQKWLTAATMADSTRAMRRSNSRVVTFADGNEGGDVSGLKLRLAAEQAQGVTLPAGQVG